MPQKSLNSMFLTFMYLVMVYINFYSSAKALAVGGTGAIMVVERIGVAGGPMGAIIGGVIGGFIGGAAAYVIEERNQNYQANQAEGKARNNPSNKYLAREAKESRELADSWWR